MLKQIMEKQLIAEMLGAGQLDGEEDENDDLIENFAAIEQMSMLDQMYR